MAAFVLMVLCVVLDRDASKVLEALSWLTLAFAAVTDRQGALRIRVGPIIPSLAVVLLCMAAAAWFGGDFPEAAGAFVKYQVGVLWLAILWLAAPIFLYPHWRDLHPLDENRRAGRLVYWLVALVLAFAFYVSISAAASMFPKDSMKLLGAEILSYAGLFVVLTRLVACADSRWMQTGLRAAWGVVLFACFAMAAVAVAALASPETAEHLLEQELFRVDDDAPDTRRLQFLFHHHNRAGYFAACGIFLSLAGAVGSRWWRAAGIAGAAAAAIALPFTLTRGALIAAAIGMAIFALAAITRHKRARWPSVAAVVIAIPLMWLLLPLEYKEHIAKIAQPENYQKETRGSIGARLIMWHTAVAMIERRPGLGFGYGFENFVSAAQADHPDKPDFFEDAAHAHNIWLETAAENGIGGAVLLLAFTVLRIGGLATTWWRAMRRRHPLAWLLLLWLCLEVVVQVYGVTNYALRRNMGFLTYWIWAGSAMLIVMSARAEPFASNRRVMELPKY